MRTRSGCTRGIDVGSKVEIYRLMGRLAAQGKGIIFVIEPKTGLPEGTMPLALTAEGIPQPEIMTAREMLAVGNPFVRLPELSR